MLLAETLWKVQPQASRQIKPLNLSSDGKTVLLPIHREPQTLREEMIDCVFFLRADKLQAFNLALKQFKLM